MKGKQKATKESKYGRKNITKDRHAPSNPYAAGLAPINPWKGHKNVNPNTPKIKDKWYTKTKDKE